MKNGFYGKLAWNNIRNNYRFFIPRILSESGLLACFYIAVTLATDHRISEIKGGDYMPFFMGMAVVILGLLSLVLMFYTNSFLMKQRKREFGMYNVLGMEKKHVCRVLFHESFISCVISVALGLCLGVLFYKLCSLLICKLLKASVILGFDFITPISLIPSAGFFILVDLLAFAFNTVTIARMKPVDLLQSKSAGEKEPKVKWVMLVAGVLTMGAGYVISLTTKSPIQALGLFFLAVILVIIGTYFLFVTGTTFILKKLKNNKKYYYNKKHMPSVSGLLYRMKQNAVGLASIAILATGVLVMVSTTVSLYSGIDGTLANNYPNDMYLSAIYDVDKHNFVPFDVLHEVVEKSAKDNNIGIKDIIDQEYLYVPYVLKENELILDDENHGSTDYSNFCNVVYITKDMYTQLMGTELDLKEDEVAVCPYSLVNDARLSDEVKIGDMTFKIKESLLYFPLEISIMASAYSSYGIVVSDDAVMDRIEAHKTEVYGADYMTKIKRVAVDFDVPRNQLYEEGENLISDVQKNLENAILPDGVKSMTASNASWSYDNVISARESVIGMYGSLLFLGILLGTVCMFATVLIIYYKQISEGYEDRGRYQIMEKIGMSSAEVKKTINSQVLLTFFLPLIVAGVHLVFVYPMLQKLLKILMYYDKYLFLTCTVVTFFVFALVYVLIYKGTSRTYYKIVR